MKCINRERFTLAFVILLRYR